MALEATVHCSVIHWNMMVGFYILYGKDSSLTTGRTSGRFQHVRTCTTYSQRFCCTTSGGKPMGNWSGYPIPGPLGKQLLKQAGS